MDPTPTPTQHSAAEQLHDLLAGDQEIADVLNELAHIAATEVSERAPVRCGVLLTRDKRVDVIGTSDEEAKKMDEVQAGLDEGPCLTALQKNSIVVVPDVLEEKRWPDYMAAVRNYGFRSIMAIPLDLKGAAKAAMNSYAVPPDAFGEVEVERAKQFAALMSRALRVAVRIAKHAEASEDRRRAMESRTPIDIAVGVIMGQNRCSQDEAFDILVRASSQRNIKLRQLAQDLISSLGQPGPSTAFDA